jgi:hypothetical protein
MITPAKTTNETPKIADIKKFGNQTGDITKDIKFAVQARANFKKATEKDKREILLRLGSNQQLKDKKLVIEPKKWLVATENYIKPIE